VPTSIPTSTSTPTPVSCGGSYPGGEPNIGPADGEFASIGCGQTIIVHLGAKSIAVNPSTSDAAYDMVYYERENPAGSDQIMLDWVIVEIATSSSGPWYPVFNWYDNVVDTNTNVGQSMYGSGEQDNKPIPFSVLYGSLPYRTGIAIDVDALAPPTGLYSWVRISSPLGGDNDPAEVDAIEILP
jgi:hypothetical protein